MAASTPQQVEIASQLSAELYSRHSLRVDQQWLLRFLSTVKAPTPPMPVLVSTAHFRLLNSDITQSLARTSNTRINTGQPASRQPLVFPPNITDVNNKSTTLPSNVPVQILTITDVGMSKGAQIEAIERYERGEEVRGREVIRNIPIMNELNQSSTSNNNNNNNNNNNPNASGANATTTTGGTTGSMSSSASVKRSHGPHKLLLQDAEGAQVYAFESNAVPKLFITNTAEEGGTCIGCKLLLKKGCLVRRGLIMLQPDDVVVLGGKVDEWDTACRRGRRERLMRELKDDYESTRSRSDETEE